MIQDKPAEQDQSTGFQIILENKQFKFLWVTQILTQSSVALLNFTLLIWVFEITKLNSAVSLVVASIFLFIDDFCPFSEV